VDSGSAASGGKDGRDNVFAQLLKAGKDKEKPAL
jgi:hypothetical protein